MRSKEVTIGLASGLEARPAAMLVQVASQYNWRTETKVSMPKVLWE